MNKSHEQVHKEYMSKNAPFFGVFGNRVAGKQFFAILDENLSVLYRTDRVFSKGNFTKSIEGNAAKHGIRRGDSFNTNCRTDGSLLKLARNIFNTTTLKYYAQLDKTQPIPKQSPEFELYAKQINAIGTILDIKDHNSEDWRVEKYGTYDEYMRPGYTALGIEKYEEALAWENLGFNNSVIPFMEDL